MPKILERKLCLAIRAAKDLGRTNSFLQTMVMIAKSGHSSPSVHHSCISQVDALFIISCFQTA
jgi:hypothetical protein